MIIDYEKIVLAKGIDRFVLQQKWRKERDEAVKNFRKKSATLYVKEYKKNVLIDLGQAYCNGFRFRIDYNVNFGFIKVFMYFGGTLYKKNIWRYFEGGPSK